MGETLAFIKSLGVPTELACHNPTAHLLAREKGLGADFNMVCFCNCGMVHIGKGDSYEAEDRGSAVEVISKIPASCLAYKVLAADRNDPRKAFRCAFAHIKPTYAVVAGVFTKRHPTQAEEDARIAEEILTGSGEDLM